MGFALPENAVEAALVHHGAGRLAEAEGLYRAVLDTQPDNANALHLLGMLCHQTGRSGEAVALLRRSVELSPSTAHFHSNLAAVLGKAGHPEEALACLREAVRLRPDFAQAHNNLGVALESLGRLDEAVAAHREAIRLDPNYVESHTNLGNVLQKRGELREAVAHHRKAISLKPDYADAYRNLAVALGELGRLDEALATSQTVVALRPRSAAAHSDLLFTRNYHPDLTPQELFDEHVRWGERHARPFSSTIRWHENDPTSHRQLRVGYVSPDFRSHPVSRFFEPIISHHDRDRFEVFCYSDVAEPDEVTGRLRRHAQAWREVRGLSDERLAELIRQDRIDVLVDLTGHMANHRLLTFARKPAPVQVTCIGYPSSTGLAAMDYRVTDSRHDPERATERFHTERLVRLDPCCWCYRPDADPPEVNDLPALQSGRVTFASMNRLVKTTPQMTRLWARILSAVPESRLVVLVGPGGAGEQSIYQRFEWFGVPPDRLTLVARTDRHEYLRQYHAIDLALDTFPYNGHTTTCDALWMGVPTVTLAGEAHLSRAGLSVLSNVGLEPLVARIPRQYIENAVALARDLPRLSQLRRTLRETMKRSPLMDGPGLTRRLERSYRQMWEQWCRARP